MVHIKASSQISVIIGDIIVLAKAFRKIKFMYRNRFADKLVDKIAKKDLSIYFPKCCYL